MFGTANQLLAGIALAVGTSYLINHGKRKYAWITLVPMIFVFGVTLTACIKNILNIYIPQAADPAMMVHGILNIVLTMLIMISSLIILKDAVPGWINGKRMIPRKV